LIILVAMHAADTQREQIFQAVPQRCMPPLAAAPENPGALKNQLQNPRYDQQTYQKNNDNNP